MTTWRGKKFLTVLATLIAGGCAGDGCGSCVSPTPGGFPPESRIENAGQLRLTSHAIDALESDPAALVASFLGSDQFNLPPVCGGEDPYVCCTEGGDQPLPPPCGPIRLDLVRRGGDTPRLVINPVDSQTRVDVTARARISTVNPLPIEYTGANCDIDVVTDGNGDQDHVTVQLGLDLVQDPEAGTTRVEVLSSTFTGLETDDVEISGGVACFLADVFLKGYVVDQITDVVEGLVGNMLVEQLCNPCPGGSVDECSAFADACEDGTCMRGGQCEQQLGLAGRLAAGAVLGGFSSGQQGAMDIYEVAGGYATSNGGGLSLGILGGMLPAGAERDRCGPPAEPPPAVEIGTSNAFATNTRPDNGAPYSVGIGLHQHQIDLLSWAAYESGFVCANIGTPAMSLLNSDALSLVIRSLPNLLHGRTSPIYIGLRPQSPPVIQIGPNTFTDDGSGETVIDQPLLDISLTQAELDVYVMVDDQYVRIMTIVADLHLPLGMDVDPDGNLLPVLGDVESALSNLSVKNSEALLETPEELAETLPAIINVALPALGDALGAIELPAIGPLAIQVQPGGITSVEDNAFLAVYGDVVIATAAARSRPRPRRVDTMARVAARSAPAGDALLAGARPVIELELGAGQANLEHSYRIDRGMWSPYTRARRVSLSRRWLELPGRHRIEVRAREIDRPLTTDRTPRVLEVSLYAAPGVPAGERALGPTGSGAPVVQFHGSGDSGCDCRAGGGSGAGLALLVLAVLFGLRRRSAGVLLALLALAAPGCSCGSEEVECNGPGGECMEGEVARGPTGRWNSLAMDGDRLVAAAYEESLGDLVFIEEPGDDSLQEVRVVDGIPDATLPTYDGGYRGGVVEPGPNVGAYTSIQLRDGSALIAYHDLDGKRLKLARQDGGDWNVGEVDVDPFGLARVGLYASLAVAPDGRPTIAYMAVGVDDGSGGRLAQLRYAVASSASPSQNADWVITTIDERLISCAGLCGEGNVCVAMDGEERCATPSTDCPEECGDGDACLGGTCTPVVADPAAYDIPGGVGLYASLILLPDGRPVVVYYDRTAGDLYLAELVNATWELHPIDVGDNADTGMWCDALVDDSGTVHVAYQDAVGDRLLYTTWSDGTAGAVEIIDDGVRAGETRTHPVGASATLFIDAGGELAVAYQDGATSDAVIARRTSGSWTRDDLLSGALLDGFHISGVSKEGRSALASYQYDQSLLPAGTLQIAIDP